jgi:hypothetical protein
MQNHYSIIEILIVEVKLKSTNIFLKGIKFVYIRKL